MKTMKTIAFGATMLAIFFTTASFLLHRSMNDTDPVKPAKNGFAVIELFTSEGCSSCPPADRLIEQLELQDTSKQLYILAYHVDYWDHQGWKDRFSDRAYSRRQQQYGSWLKVEPVYTPQLIVNGTSEHIGSDQRSISEAIQEQLQQESARQLKLEGTLEGKQLLLKNNFNGGTNEELLVALIQKKAGSNVKAGENKGRQLAHVQIVRALKQVSPREREGVKMQLPGDFDKNGWEVIGFIQNKLTGRITDAAKLNW